MASERELDVVAVARKLSFACSQRGLSSLELFSAVTLVMARHGQGRVYGARDDIV